MHTMLKLGVAVTCALWLLACAGRPDDADQVDDSLIHTQQFLQAEPGMVISNFAKLTVRPVLM